MRTVAEVSGFDAIWSRHGMSNSGHGIDDGFEADLRAGMRGEHTAWNFHGQVWYDPEEDMFCEDVWRHNVKAVTFLAATLGELMRTVNDEFGWD
jgi:hypothetical protein